MTAKSCINDRFMTTAEAFNENKYFATEFIKINTLSDGGDVTIKIIGGQTCLENAKEKGLNNMYMTQDENVICLFIHDEVFEYLQS